MIVARQLTRRYGSRVGIDRVDLTVPEGSIYGFLGPNGAGKTTFIRLLLGFLQPSAGSATIFAMDVWRRSHRIKRDVGYLPGDLRLYPWMTARSAVATVGRVRGLDLRRAGEDLAERFGLEPTVRVRSMSKGMRQKLGLVLALVHEPRLLVLDEPTSGLDPLMQDALANTLRDLAAGGRTVFFSSHTLSEVEQLCDHVAIVRRGRIVADERLADLRARAGREVILEFEDAAVAEQVERPAFLRVQDRHGTRWRCVLVGEPRALAGWIAEQRVVDVTISPPDLETLFREFYGE